MGCRPASCTRRNDQKRYEKPRLKPWAQKLESFISADGRRLSHILDPRSGRPVVDAPRSITVAAATCVQAGMFTTLAMLKGAGAEEFLRDEGVRHWIRRD